MNWVLLWNSLLTSALATALAVALGVTSALWLAGLGAGWRGRWLTLAIVSLSLPPFLVVNCWLHYLGQTGVWHAWLPWNVYSLSGDVWILAILTWPISLFAALGAWQRLEAAQLESDLAVRGFALVRGLLLPLARGALTQAAVLTFVLSLNNFTVPAILQVKTFPAETWIEFNTTFNSIGALQMSWPMVAAPLLLVILFRRSDVAWPRVEGPVSPGLFRRQLGAPWFWVGGIITGVVSLLSVALPVVQLASNRRTWIEWPGAVAAGQSAIFNSLWLAVAVATICLAIALVTWRWPLGTILWLPFFMPGVLTGIGMIAVFNRPALAAFYHGAGIVIFALVLRYLAFGWNGTSRALRGTDADLADVARIEGATQWQMLRHVYWPQIVPQLAASWYVLFLLCLWDVESIVMIVPPGGETLALRIFNLLHFGHNAQVNSLCLTLLMLALLPLAAWKLARVVKFRLTVRRADWLAAVLLPMLFFTGCSEDSPTEKTLNSRFFSKVEIIGTRGVGVGEFNKPRSLTVDRDDNLYVVDMTARVQKFSPDGRFLLQWQMFQTDIGKPKGMGMDKDGNIIVVEPHYQRMNIFSTAGKLIARWGEHGTNAGQLIMPRAVAINSHGDWITPEYTVVDRVQEFTDRGKSLVRVIGHSGTENGEFNRPEGLCVDAQDRIYVADSCNHRIQVFSPDGRWLRAFGKPGQGAGELSYPYDVRVDRQGFAFVCEFENSRIQVFDPEGKSVEIIGGPGAAIGKLNNPYGICLDSQGNLYVADSQNHRVQKFIRRKDTAAKAKTAGPLTRSGKMFPGRGATAEISQAQGAWTGHDTISRRPEGTLGKSRLLASFQDAQPGAVRPGTSSLANIPAALWAADTGGERAR